MNPRHANDKGSGPAWMDRDRCWRTHRLFNTLDGELRWPERKGYRLRTAHGKFHIAPGEHPAEQPLECLSRKSCFNGASWPNRVAQRYALGP
jgi:hypothetical protein